MKPRIRPRPSTSPWFECRGRHPKGDQTLWYGYGSTPEEAYQNWLDEPIPF